MSNNSTLSESAIEKAVLAISKLEGRENWDRWAISIEMALDSTWEYVWGNKTSPPAESDPDFPTWSNANRAARRRIWLSLSDKVQDSIFRHSRSDAATLFKALKNQYESSGASAEFYARKNYDDAKLSDYNSVTDFLTGLTNLAHLVNREVAGSTSGIEDRTIAMRVIHSLPPPMRTLQTILIKTSPPLSSKTPWDLDDLKRDIEADELRARAAGENLGTKTDLTHEPKALVAQGDPRRGRKPDPLWILRQTCWNCGKTGHLRQKCPSSQAERQAYRDKRNGERTEISAQVTTEPEVYVAIMDDTAYSATQNNQETATQKTWLIDSGCTSHLTPNRSNFISYKPYNVPRSVRVGNGSCTPSLSEGVISLKCVVDNVCIDRRFQDVQYIPGLTNGLLLCKVLDQCGLHMKIGEGIFKIT